MGVDEPGVDDSASQVTHLRRPHRRDHLLGGSYGDDTSVGYGYGAVAEDAALSIHGDHGAVGQHEVGGQCRGSGLMG